MKACYHNRGGIQYSCVRHLQETNELPCAGLAGWVIDELVSGQVLRALEPAAVELSLKAHADIKQERQRLEKHWQQRCQRARYEVELAQRRYQAVDPENRLVASTLERSWEELLRQEQQLAEDYDRFFRAAPLQLTDADRARMEALTSDIPALWHATRTTNADRKQIVRCLIERVVVQARCDSELVDVTVHWAGGYQSQHEITRPVQSYAQLRDYKRLMDRLAELREAGHTVSQIASTLNTEGFRTSRRFGELTVKNVQYLLKRCGLIGNERSHDELLGPQEWWLADLAHELQMSHLKLRDWAVRGWVHSRRTRVQGYWILWADQDELRRLGKLMEQSRRGINAHTSDLKRPKERPTAK
jgi:hypothetical protein